MRGGGGTTRRRLGACGERSGRHHEGGRWGFGMSWLRGRRGGAARLALQVSKLRGRR